MRPPAFWFFHWQRKILFWFSEPYKHVPTDLHAILNAESGHIHQEASCLLRLPPTTRRGFVLYD